jgi:hypothetical protein
MLGMWGFYIAWLIFAPQLKKHLKAHCVRKRFFREMRLRGMLRQWW